MTTAKEELEKFSFYKDTEQFAVYFSEGLNKIYDDGETLLTSLLKDNAIDDGKRIHLLSELVNKGYDINLGNGEILPLKLAIETNNTAVVDFFIDKYKDRGALLFNCLEYARTKEYKNSITSFLKNADKIKFPRDGLSVGSGPKVVKLPALKSRTGEAGGASREPSLAELLSVSGVASSAGGASGMSKASDKLVEIWIRKIAQQDFTLSKEEANKIYHDGETLLTCLLKNREIDEDKLFKLLKELIKNGCDVNISNGETTPLLLSLERGNLEVIKILTDNKLFNLKNAYLLASSSDEIMPNGQESGSAGEKILKILYTRIEEKEIILSEEEKNKIYTDGETLLTSALVTYQGLPEMTMKLLSFLIMSGCDVNIPALNLTPLLVAIEKGDLPLVELLLSHGARVDVFSRDGVSPLLMACQLDKLDIVESLLRFHGNNVDEVFIKAVETNKLEVIRLLFNKVSRTSVLLDSIVKCIKDDNQVMVSWFFGNYPVLVDFIDSILLKTLNEYSCSEEMIRLLTEVSSSYKLVDRASSEDHSVFMSSGGALKEADSVKVASERPLEAVHIQKQIYSPSQAGKLDSGVGVGAGAGSSSRSFNASGSQLLNSLIKLSKANQFTKIHHLIDSLDSPSHAAELTSIIPEELGLMEASASEVYVGYVDKYIISDITFLAQLIYKGQYDLIVKIISHPKIEIVDNVLVIFLYSSAIISGASSVVDCILQKPYIIDNDLPEIMNVVLNSNNARILDSFMRYVKNSSYCKSKYGDMIVQNFKSYADCCLEDNPFKQFATEIAADPFFSIDHKFSERENCSNLLTIDNQDMQLLTIYTQLKSSIIVNNFIDTDLEKLLEIFSLDHLKIIAQRAYLIKEERFPILQDLVAFVMKRYIERTELSILFENKDLLKRLAFDILDVNIIKLLAEKGLFIQGDLDLYKELLFVSNFSKVTAKRVEKFFKEVFMIDQRREEFVTHCIVNNCFTNFAAKLLSCATVFNSIFVDFLREEKHYKALESYLKSFSERGLPITEKLTGISDENIWVLNSDFGVLHGLIKEQVSKEIVELSFQIIYMTLKSDNVIFEFKIVGALACYESLSDHKKLYALQIDLIEKFLIKNIRLQNFSKKEGVHVDIWKKIISVYNDTKSPALKEIISRFFQDFFSQRNIADILIRPLISKNLELLTFPAPIQEMISKLRDEIRLRAMDEISRVSDPKSKAKKKKKPSKSSAAKTKLLDASVSDELVVESSTKDSKLTASEVTTNLSEANRLLSSTFSASVSEVLAPVLVSMTTTAAKAVPDVTATAVESGSLTAKAAPEAKALVEIKPDTEAVLVSSTDKAATKVKAAAKAVAKAKTAPVAEAAIVVTDVKAAPPVKVVPAETLAIAKSRASAASAASTVSIVKAESKAGATKVGPAALAVTVLSPGPVAKSSDLAILPRGVRLDSFVQAREICKMESLATVTEPVSAPAAAAERTSPAAAFAVVGQELEVVKLPGVNIVSEQLEEYTYSARVEEEAGSENSLNYIMSSSRAVFSSGGEDYTSLEDRAKCSIFEVDFKGEKLKAFLYYLYPEKIVFICKNTGSHYMLEGSLTKAPYTYNYYVANRERMIHTNPNIYSVVTTAKQYIFVSNGRSYGASEVKDKCVIVPLKGDGSWFGEVVEGYYNKELNDGKLRFIDPFGDIFEISGELIDIDKELEEDKEKKYRYELNGCLYYGTLIGSGKVIEYDVPVLSSDGNSQCYVKAYVCKKNIISYVNPYNAEPVSYEGKLLDTPRSFSRDELSIYNRLATSLPSISSEVGHITGRDFLAPISAAYPPQFPSVAMAGGYFNSAGFATHPPLASYHAHVNPHVSLAYGHPTHSSYVGGAYGSSIHSAGHGYFAAAASTDGYAPQSHSGYRGGAYGSPMHASGHGYAGAASTVGYLPQSQSSFAGEGYRSPMHPTSPGHYISVPVGYFVLKTRKISEQESHL